MSGSVVIPNQSCDWLMNSLAKVSPRDKCLAYTKLRMRPNDISYQIFNRSALVMQVVRFTADGNTFVQYEYSLNLSPIDRKLSSSTIFCGNQKAVG